MNVGVKAGGADCYCYYSAPCRLLCDVGGRRVVAAGHQKWQVLPNISNDIICFVGGPSWYAGQHTGCVQHAMRKGKCRSGSHESLVEGTSGRKHSKLCNRLHHTAGITQFAPVRVSIALIAVAVILCPLPWTASSTVRVVTVCNQ